MMPDQHLTNHIAAPHTDLAVLKAHFPQFFDKTGAFDFEGFRNRLQTENPGLQTEKESYSLDWLGKSYARLLAADAATTLLREDEGHNAPDKNKISGNLLLKGDNLEVLKHLAGAYYEKVKMIYIDPPYNTGNDGFVYHDDRKFTAKELQKLAGIDEERARRILQFTQSRSNSHSAWLTFMYPRLYIARQLLREDGVIFISIDDNEVAQLRLLMDEVFGEENFVGEIVWQTATDNNPTQIATEHEYVLVYVKSSVNQQPWVAESIKAKKIEEKYLELKNQFDSDLVTIQVELRKWIRSNKNFLDKVSHYDNVDEFGVFHDADIANTKFGGYEYDIIHPVTNKVCKVPEKGYRFPEHTMLRMLERGDLMFGSDENTLPKPKKRLEDSKDVLRSIIYEDGRASTKELEKMLGAKSVFNNPKSTTVLIRFLSFVTASDDLILDFFAGSGTTGEAVMQLNAEDGGFRKFMLVQLPEPIDPRGSKAAYDFVKGELSVAEPTIFEITKERLSRAAAKINAALDAKTEAFRSQVAKLEGEAFTAENKAEVESLQAQIAQHNRLKTQNAFRIFETQPIWDDYDFVAEEGGPQAVLFDETQLTADDLKTLLTTWKTADGLPLTEDLAPVDLAGYTGYYGSGKLYLMDRGFTTAGLKALLEKVDSDPAFNLTVVVAFGYHFESRHLRELAENLKAYANRKGADIDFITRY